jgi:general secretion pathway protein E
MLLVDRTTGSGKTTTLYAVISDDQPGSGQIITIEDPVEYRLPRVLQIPVNENTRDQLSSARFSCSILRHAPVTRSWSARFAIEPKTAQIAVQSALTGHLVFTRVHANIVFDVIAPLPAHAGRSVQLRVALNGGAGAAACPPGVVRTARSPIRPDAAHAGRFGHRLSGMAAEFRFVHGTGCGHCSAG